MDRTCFLACLSILLVCTAVSSVGRRELWAFHRIYLNLIMKRSAKDPDGTLDRPPQVCFSNGACESALRVAQSETRFSVGVSVFLKLRLADLWSLEASLHSDQSSSSPIAGGFVILPLLRSIALKRSISSGR